MAVRAKVDTIRRVVADLNPGDDRKAVVAHGRLRELVMLPDLTDDEKDALREVAADLIFRVFAVKPESGDD